MLGEQLQGKWGQPGPCTWGSMGEPGTRCRLASLQAGHSPIHAIRGLGSGVLNPDRASNIFGDYLETPISGPFLQRFSFKRGGDREASSGFFFF